MLNTVAVDALAAFRITRLIVEDHITAGLREKVKHTAAREIDSPGLAAKVDTLLSCPWCVSVHVSVGVVVLRRVAPRLWDPLARVLAFSALSGVISENWG